MKIGIAIAVVALCGCVTVNAYAQAAGTVKKEKAQAVTQKAKDAVACPHHTGAPAGKADCTTAKHATDAKEKDCCKKDAKAGSTVTKTKEECMKSCEEGAEGCEKHCAKQGDASGAGKH
jgi:hypothetical protein